MEGLDLGAHLLAPVSILHSRQSKLPQNFNKTTFFGSLETPADWSVALARLGQVKKSLEDIQELLEEGARRGITFAQESLGSRVRKQFERQFVDKPEESGFFGPFRDISGPNKTVVDLVKARALNTIEGEVLPAMKRLFNYVMDDYSERSLRSGPGVNNVANGDAFYQKCLQYHTSIIGMTAEQIHEIGLQEIEKLKDGVRKLSRKLKYGNVSVREFFDKLGSEKGQSFSSKQEVLDHVRDLLFKRINPALSKIFPDSLLTDKLYALDFKAAPEGSGIFAFYIPGPKDGSKNGTYFVDLDDITTVKKYSLLSLTLHEAIPGHHFDYTVFGHAHESPDFIRGGGFGSYNGPPAATASYTAFIEGWALYSEFLGFELGLFEEPEDLAGFYTHNFLRACRLVVDTGLHSMGWSRQQAIDYMTTYTGMSNITISNEVDRYITWPGQAVAYKIGERAIRDLRAKKEKELGDQFDLKAFHARILHCRGPMDTLEECVNLVEMEEENDDNKNEEVTSSSTNIKASLTHILFFLLLGMLHRIKV